MVQKRETKAINKLCVREILSLSFVCGAYFFEFRGRNLVCFGIAYNFDWGRHMQIRAGSREGTHAHCVFHACLLVFQTNPGGVKLFSYKKRFLLFQQICIGAAHVSENALLQKNTRCQNLTGKNLLFTRVAVTFAHWNFYCFRPSTAA